jgi:hypothetical protein
MACNYIADNVWDIAATTGRVVDPFVAPNQVSASEDRGGSFTVTVRSPEGTQLGQWGGFSCQGDGSLTGIVTVSTGSNTLLMVPDPKQGPTDRNKVIGEWDPTANTAGTWTGNEGGGPTGGDLT